MARGVDFYKERRYLAELGQRSASFKFGAHQQAPDSEPETVVLVLGESSRYDRWSLNGYARDTNPLLRQEANLVDAAGRDHLGVGDAAVGAGHHLAQDRRCRA